MARLKCQCGHKFVVDFERLTVQSARKVRCPECGQSFPLLAKDLGSISTAVEIPLVTTTDPAPEVESSQATNPAIWCEAFPRLESDDDRQINGKSTVATTTDIVETELKKSPSRRLFAESISPIATKTIGLGVIVLVLVLSIGVNFNGQPQQPLISSVITNLLLIAIWFELWRLRRNLDK